MSYYDKSLDSLEKRLEFAWEVVRKKGPGGVFVREISQEILGIKDPTPGESRTVGMVMKAMLARGMVERVGEKRRAKDPTLWRAVDKMYWKPIISDRLAAAKTESDDEQAMWHHSVVKEVRERNRFRAKMANRL